MHFTFVPSNQAERESKLTKVHSFRRLKLRTDAADKVVAFSYPANVSRIYARKLE